MWVRDLTNDIRILLDSLCAMIHTVSKVCHPCVYFSMTPKNARLCTGWSVTNSVGMYVHDTQIHFGASLFQFVWILHQLSSQRFVCVSRATHHAIMHPRPPGRRRNEDHLAAVVPRGSNQSPRTPLRASRNCNICAQAAGYRL